ncbi:MAG: PEGA domain-containing protein [Deltaproteobacteria bacterium]
MLGNVYARRSALRGGALSLLLCLATAAAITLVPTRSSAAEAAKSERAVARRLVVEGDSFFARRNYARALERYAEAYRVMHVPTVGVEVVKAQRALGKLVEATQTAREVAALPEQSGEPAVFDQARLQAAQDVVSLSGMTPALLLDVAPRGAPFAVQIDGVSPAGETPFLLNPGAHQLRVSADGYRSVEQAVTLQEGERLTLTVQLFPDPAHAPPGVASTGVASTGVANTRAEPKPTTPAAAASHGAHASRGRTLGWVGIGVAGVGVASGTFAGINALQTKPDCPNDVCSPSQRNDIRNSKTMGTIADISFGVAIVAGALGIWQLATSSADDSESAALPPTGPLAGSERARAFQVTAVDLGTGPFELRLSGCF